MNPTAQVVRSLFNHPRWIILGVFVFTTGCSFIFPKQFQDFATPEQIEGLDSEELQPPPSKSSTTPSESHKNTSIKDTLDPQELGKHQEEPIHAENRSVSSIKSNRTIDQNGQNELNIIPAQIPLRDSIEVGLNEHQAKIQLKTPQPIRISYDGSFIKSKGNTTFKACGKLVCIASVWSSKKLSETVQVSPKFDFLTHQSHHYRGVFIIKNIHGKLALINKLEVEEYLRGVLPHEIGTLGEWGYEALKAQAVAARTYTYKHLDRRRKNGFDIYADTRDQMYLGASKEYALSNNAIESTRGQVMTYDSQLIQAFYHSTCGGKTADISQVWDSDPIPYLITRSDINSEGKAWCSPSRLFEWEYRFSDKYFTQQISKNAPKASRDIKSKLSSPQLTIQKRSPSGHIEFAKLRGNGKSYQITGDKVRWLIKPPQSNFSILPSSKVKMDYKKGQWHIHGSGFGHGIGLCQYGARERSRAGQGYLEILSAYYTGISISKKP